jgi:fumarylacetoacetase
MLAGIEAQLYCGQASEVTSNSMKSNLQKSWLDSANVSGCDFPLHNLPFCAFVAEDESIHLGIGIGDVILDLRAITLAGLLDALPQDIRLACCTSTLNALMQYDREATTKLRGTLTRLLSEEATASAIHSISACLHPIATAVFTKPVSISNYTDFYASLHHATNVGKLFRPNQPLLPNYKYIPIGYHGRASSIVLSDTPIIRPRGQTKSPASDSPIFDHTQQLDYELEVAAYISNGNALGYPILIDQAEQHLFGISLLNDWSARDIQSWEYQPLGPFLGKSFATTVSPWVVPMEALASYRITAKQRPPGDPVPLPYLSFDAPAAIDLQLEIFLTTRRSREEKLPLYKLSSGNLRDLYWTFPQLVAHHTSNGCNLLTGDLLASGTVSGSEPGTEGSLLEMTQRGARPIMLPNCETRTYLEDGDEIILRGFCERDGLPRIGLGECRGTIVSGTHPL